MDKLTLDRLRNVVDDAKSAVKAKLGTDVEKKLEEALSNKNWGASSTLLNEIAQLTYDYESYTVIMTKIWEATDSHARQWRTVFKALTLLEHLIKNGTERVVENARDHMFKLRSLTNFSYHDGSQDKGAGVREKTKQILDLLNDNDRIRDEREKSRKLRDKYTGVGSGGSGGFSGGGFSGGGFSGGGYSGGGGGGFSGGGGYSGGQGGGGGYNGGGGGGYSGGSSYSGGGGYGGNSDRNDERDKGYSSRYADEQDDYRSARGGRREKSRDESESEEEEEDTSARRRVGSRKKASKKKEDDEEPPATKGPSATPSLLDDDFFGSAPANTASSGGGGSFDPFGVSVTAPAQQSFNAFGGAPQQPAQSAFDAFGGGNASPAPAQSNAGFGNFPSPPSQPQPGFVNLNAFGQPSVAPQAPGMGQSQTGSFGGSAPFGGQFGGMQQPMQGGPMGGMQNPMQGAPMGGMQGMQNPMQARTGSNPGMGVQQARTASNSKPAEPARNDAWGAGSSLFDLNNLGPSSAPSSGPPSTGRSGPTGQSQNSFSGLDTLAGMPTRTGSYGNSGGMNPMGGPRPPMNSGGMGMGMGMGGMQQPMGGMGMGGMGGMQQPMGGMGMGGMGGMQPMGGMGGMPSMGGMPQMGGMPPMGGMPQMGGMQQPRPIMGNMAMGGMMNSGMGQQQQQQQQQQQHNPFGSFGQF